MVDLSQIENQHWEEAQRRASVLRPLAELKDCPLDKALEAANELGLSKRQIYRLIKRLRDADGGITALVKRGSNGGRDKHRLDALRENIINRLITEFFLTRQKKSKASLVREIRKVSLSSGLKPASESTIRRRLKKLSPAQLKQRGEQHPEAKPIYGETPVSDTPLDWIQMDHTPVDLIIVDPIDRLPIGRPWITIAIDVFSRCIAGFFLSLEAPSATSVGLCLTMVVSDKKTWLEQRGIDASWPIVGKPCRIGVDNASEFHSAAFERGCKQHGIEIEWRPPGQPHFGGIVERIIGTLMTLIHELPGTTFSNPNQRGDYDSDKTSCLTLEEFERWLALAITKYYHLKPHVGMDKDIPLYRYEQGIQAMAHIGKTIPMPRDPRAFLIDFLPAIRRSLQRDGIVIDHITYYSDALRPWIRLQKESGSLLIRRDPRDLSQVYIFDAENNFYFTVPYRMLSRPPITLWEHKLARKRLREQRQEKIDENSLFAAIDEMREIERNAETMTRTARRNRTRRQAVLASGNPAKQNQPLGSQDYTEPISPYEDIELW